MKSKNFMTLFSMFNFLLRKSYAAIIQLREDCIHTVTITSYYNGFFILKKFPFCSDLNSVPTFWLTFHNVKCSLNMLSLA